MGKDMNRYFREEETRLANEPMKRAQHHSFTVRETLIKTQWDTIFHPLEQQKLRNLTTLNVGKSVEEESTSPLMRIWIILTTLQWNFVLFGKVNSQPKTAVPIYARGTFAYVYQETCM